ncbi:isoleucine--tRNA ligase [Candidatus Kaiserbacteria bacterium]|nr:isoleucine--tRNA ligase [Candidatus Kaiserbacteria bacterium]
MDDKKREVSEVAKREEDILAFWNKNEIFRKTVDREPAKGDFVFYDGPPFATGLPHYGHLLQSFVKDAIPRYKTMQGYRVERRWGWDCHGLPIENIVEKELGTKSKKDIVQMGVKKFNDLCRERIFTFIGEWERIIPRIGRFVDMKHAYRTMDFSYMESEWWAFKTLYEKGLIYEDYRSMHICPRCETTLSQGEVAEGYKDVKDISVTVKFELVNEPGTYLLAWTTTPWTLPGNVAIAVGADITYIKIEDTWNEDIGDSSYMKTGVYILSKQSYEHYKQEFKNPKIVGEMKGSDLVGTTYKPPFSYYIDDEHLKNRENGWKVYAADFVTEGSGTGIAHEAPTFGADDWALLKKYDLPFVQHVGMDGRMKPEVIDLAGMEVKPRSDDDKTRLGTDIVVLKYLQDHHLFFSKENITHAYPHCWRCDTPLLNYAMSSWFVAVEKMKPTLLETAQSINWSPEHIKEGRFGKWLEGARDWSISRQRFWANTIPVWRCEACKKDQVFGSAAELAQVSNVTVTDLHKDVVDKVKVSCACGGTAARVPDVLDTWFDSGSVPFSSEHYPFENEQRYEARETADFIGEAQDQTRAWFYYLHVLSGGLFGKAAFKNCIVTGLVMAQDGKKMSKKLQNYPDPMEIVDKYGADALRLYILSAPIVQAENLNFSERGVDEVQKKNINRLHNVLAFYQLYADGTPRDFKSENILDRWIVARLAALIAESTDGFEAYELDVALRPFALFIDDLSVWYLRRSRERFKEDDDDKKAALATLRYVLHTLARVLAPTMPFYAEYLFQAVREEEDEESVHLSAWPAIPPLSFDPTEVLATMLFARSFVTMALMQRSEAGIKVRQPLAKLTIKHRGPEVPFWKEVVPIIADEVNVKEVVLDADAGQDTPGISLDTHLTLELIEEGLMREMMRFVQGQRKDMKLVPSDKIRLTVLESEAVRRHEAEIGKTLNASEIVYALEWQGVPLKLTEGDIVVGIEKI